MSSLAVLRRTAIVAQTPYNLPRFLTAFFLLKLYNDQTPHPKCRALVPTTTQKGVGT